MSFTDDVVEPNASRTELKISCTVEAAVSHCDWICPYVSISSPSHDDFTLETKPVRSAIDASIPEITDPRSPCAESAVDSLYENTPPTRNTPFDKTGLEESGRRHRPADDQPRNLVPSQFADPNVDVNCSVCCW